MIRSLPLSVLTQSLHARVSGSCLIGEPHSWGFANATRRAHEWAPKNNDFLTQT